jgi:hypothetical protein
MNLTYPVLIFTYLAISILSMNQVQIKNFFDFPNGPRSMTTQLQTVGIECWIRPKMAPLYYFYLSSHHVDGTLSPLVCVTYFGTHKTVYFSSCGGR